jgi:hypothetical protein
MAQQTRQLGLSPGGQKELAGDPCESPGGTQEARSPNSHFLRGNRRSDPPTFDKQEDDRNLPAPRRRNLLVFGGRFRQEHLARRFAGIPRDRPEGGSARLSGAVTIRKWGPSLGRLRIASPGRSSPQNGLCSSHPNHGEASPSWSRLLRPLFPKPGHFTQGRLRQPDRASTSVDSQAKRQQLVCGR